MEHVTVRRDSTSPSSLLQSFIFPLLLFAPSLISVPAALLCCPNQCAHPVHPVFVRTFTPVDGTLYICTFSLPFSLMGLSVNFSFYPHHFLLLFCLYVHSFVILYSMPSWLPLGLPLSLFPPPPPLLPLVLSQLGCGLDGSGPQLPSPRLQQQHQPQIQVIQQL